MANPIFSAFQRTSQGSNNPFELLTRFNQFKSNFQGDPKARVQELLDSGQMTQEQFNQFSQMARQLQNIIK